MLSNFDEEGIVISQVAPGDVGSSPTTATEQKRFAICHKSGTVLFRTNDKFIAANRESFGWIVNDSWQFPR